MTASMEGGAASAAFPSTPDEAACLSDPELARIMAGDKNGMHKLLDLLGQYDRDREIRMAASDALAGAALWYASLGVAVFPCRPGEKVPLTGNGFYGASTDRAVVREWWRRWPQANIGAPTGATFDCLDVDSPAKRVGAPNGYFTLADIRDQGLLPEVLGRAATPSGGCHLFVAVAAGSRSKAGLGPGLDLRGDGGYVIMPPSRDRTGRRYVWTTMAPAFLRQGREVA